MDASMMSEMKAMAEENRRLKRMDAEMSMQNAYIERYNRTVRHEWLWTYNNDRPNMGIGGITPAMKLKMAA